MITTTIAWLDRSGAGVAHVGKKRVFVPRVLPGEEVQFELDAAGRVVPHTVKVLSPSPARRTPTCPVDASCGGCDWSHIAPEQRIAWMADRVKRSLQWEGPLLCVPSPLPHHHRARIKLQIRGTQVGYHAPRSHDLVPITSCEAARTEVNDALAPLLAWLADHPDHPFHEVEIRSDGRRAIYALGTRLPRAKWGRWAQAVAPLGDVAISGRAVCGDPSLVIDVGDRQVDAAPDAFYQVNLEGNAQLAAYVASEVRSVQPERLLDLYAGNGNLSLGLAAEGVPVLAVEREGASIRSAKARAEAQGLHRFQTLHVDARAFDPSREPFDVVITDPPRAGMGGVLSKVLRNRPRKVVYVSCHLPSLVRDLKGLAREGYRLTAARAFELFPGTHHVETVVSIARIR